MLLPPLSFGNSKRCVYWLPSFRLEFLLLAMALPLSSSGELPLLLLQAERKIAATKRREKIPGKDFVGFICLNGLVIVCCFCFSIAGKEKVRANAYATTFDRTLYCCGYIVLLLQLTVTVHEAVYATCSVHKFALTCIEWVRGA